MFMVLGRRSYLGLTPAYLKVIGSQAQLKAMVNGELYENTAMGIPVSKSFHLEKTYTKGQVNRDNGYNFTNVNGLLINKQVWAYPINMDTIQQVLDNDTANPKWIGKVQYATPTILYPKTCKIILEVAPTQQEIDQATANLNKSFRVPVDYVIGKPALSTIITTPNLGAITMAGTEPNTTELETAIKAKNNKYVNGNATFSSITATGALATANPNKYSETVNLTYSK